MPTAESVFPKVGNDPLFVSEVNTFNPKLTGEDSATNAATDISGPGGIFTTIGGTILYQGTIGSAQMRQYLELTTSVDSDLAGDTDIRFRISGTAGLDDQHDLVVGGFQPANAVMYYTHVYTSGNITASGGNIGSDYVLSIEGQAGGTTANVHRGTFKVWSY